MSDSPVDSMPGGPDLNHLVSYPHPKDVLVAIRGHRRRNHPPARRDREAGRWRSDGDARRPAGLRSGEPLAATLETGGRLARSAAARSAAPPPSSSLDTATQRLTGRF